MELLSVETWVVAVVLALIISVILVVFIVLPCASGMFGGNDYEYMLLNIAPGTSPEALQEHLRLNLQSKLKECGFLLGKTTAIFSCSQTLDRDDWENCEKYGGHGLVLVHKISDKQVECSDKFTYTIQDCTRIQTRFKEIRYQDANRKTFHRVQLSGPWTEIMVILDQLPGSDQCFSRSEPSQMSYSVHDETRRPLIGKNNGTDKPAKRQENRIDVRPHCDSNKKESLDIEEELYRYAMTLRRGEMERILNPKPVFSEFKSGSLMLVGQACLVSKAAEDIAVFCQKLTASLSKAVFKLSEGINAEAFKSEAESRVAAPSKTLLFTGSDDTLTLYGPKDKLQKVMEGLKNLENQLRSPGIRIPFQPKSGSVTPHHQAEQLELMRPFAEQVAPRSGFPSGFVYAAPNRNNVEPKQNIPRSMFEKVEVKSQPINSGYQQRSNGEASHNSFPREIEKPKLNKITVSVLKGDLTKQTTNVIVNPANRKLLHGGGAAKAIAEAAGPHLVNECHDYIQKYGELKTGHVMHTTAGYLSPRIQYVIHAAGPNAGGYPDQRDLERKLEETFFNCLRCANDKLRAKSISIPAISAGIFGVPKELVARAAHTALKKFEQEGTGGAITLEKVNFVNIDDESTGAFLEVFGGTRPRRASGDADLGRTGSAERGKSRSKSVDQPKRMRVLKNGSSSSDHSGAANGLSNGVATATVANGDDSDDCVICMETMTSPKVLPCGHKFCADCIKDSFEKCQPKCPSCGRLFGVMRGNQPPGKMHVNTIPQSLKGYEKYKTILVEYDIPNGIQNDTHPNPGVQYWGTSRSAYLPDCKEGREVCDLLRQAFDAGLVFTVGRSSTTGRDNQVIWNDIHHKTSEIGQYGYPDPTYLSRVKDELKAKGIVSDADDYKHKQTAI